MDLTMCSIAIRSERWKEAARLYRDMAEIWGIPVTANSSNLASYLGALLNVRGVAVYKPAFTTDSGIMFARALLSIGLDRYAKGD